MFYFSEENYRYWPVRFEWEFHIPVPFCTLIFFAVVFHIVVALYERRYAWWRVQIPQYKPVLYKLGDEEEKRKFESVIKDRKQMLQKFGEGRLPSSLNPSIFSARRDMKKQTVYEMLQHMDHEYWMKEKRRCEQMKRMEYLYRTQILERRREDWIQSLLKKHLKLQELQKEEFIKKIEKKIPLAPKRSDCVYCRNPICCGYSAQVCCKCRCIMLYKH